MTTSLERILEYVERQGYNPLAIVSAPGRADFLNTHQDYKGLPVVPVAVNLRTVAVAVGRVENGFIIESLSLRREGREYIDRFGLESIELRGRKWFGDYFRAVVRSISTFTGERFSYGLHVVVDSDVPIGSGLASSAALEVSFTKLLDVVYGLGLEVRDIAELSFLAENKVMSIPCGRLDQYGSAYGKAILLYPRPPVRVVELPLMGMDIVIADSGIRHSVADIHPRRQEEINRGLKQLLSLDIPSSLREKLSDRYDKVRWEDISLREIEPYLSRIDKIASRRIRYTIETQKTTMLAVKLIKGEELDQSELSLLGIEDGDRLDILGRIMDIQHEMMRDLYDLSLPRLEKIRDAMLKAGALGVKISGAGLGGALIALVSDREVIENIRRAALNAGATACWTVRVDEGVREEKLRETL